MHTLMYGRHFNLVYRPNSTKSHPDFNHKSDSSLFLPVSTCISITPHFHLLFSCCCHQGNMQFKKLLLSNSRQYPASSQRETETFQSVNKALLLPSNHVCPSPTSSVYAGNAGWSWKVHSRRVIMCLQLWWLWSFG